MLRQAVILVIAFAVAGSVAAMEASSLQASGQVDSEATLVLLLREGAGPEASDFTLEAQALRVEVDSGSTVALDATYHSINPTTDTDGYGPSTVTPLGVRDRHEWMLLPTQGHDAPRIVVSSDCLEVAATDEPVKRTPWVKGTRGALSLDADRVAQAGACGAAVTVEVHGDFTLALWEWDVRLESDGEAREIHTGRSPAGPAGTPADFAVQERRQAFLYAEGAVLRAPLDSQAVIYIREAKVETHGSLLVRDAHGVIAAGAEAIAVDAGSVLATGDMVAGVSRSDDGLQVNLGGEIRELRVNGQAIVADPSTEAQAYLMWFAAATVLMAGAAWFWRHPVRVYEQQRLLGGDVGSQAARSLRQRRGAGYWLMAEKANVRGRHRRATWCANRAVRLFPTLPEARLLRAISWGHRRRPAAAIRDVRSCYAELPEGRLRAMAACTAASSARQLGQTGESEKWLDLAAQEAPDFLRQRLQSPTFWAYEGQPFLERLKRSVAEPSDPAVS